MNSFPTKVNGEAYIPLRTDSSCGDLYTIGLDSAQEWITNHPLRRREKRRERLGGITYLPDFCSQFHLPSKSCRRYWRHPPIADPVSVVPLRNGIVICDCRNALNAWVEPVTARMPTNQCLHFRMQGLLHRRLRLGMARERLLTVVRIISV